MFRQTHALRFALAGDMLVLSLLAGASFLQPSAPADSPPPRQVVDLQAIRLARIAALDADLDTLVAAGSSNVGVALLTSERELLASESLDRPFVLASVAKVYILAAYLGQVSQDGSKVTESDLALLQDMIEWSDNHSASVLWSRIGGPAGLASFLQQRGLPPVWPTEDESEWGTLAASPRQVADLLWSLRQGALLDPESTQIALTLLSEVDESQRWGISAGVFDEASRVMLKNGWYPEEEGWRLNSAGIVATGYTTYVLVVLSDSAPSMEQGIDLIERVASRVNAFMASDR